MFLSQSLNQFILKLSKIKNNLEINDYSLRDKSLIKVGINNIFETILNNYDKTEEKDNIILIFIDAKDIRFDSEKEFLNTVGALNDNNFSVFFFCFDEIIEKNKINNIQSFINGLIEGYLFKVKNYQQLKEIFINLSSNNYQMNQFKFNYDSFDHYL